MSIGAFTSVGAGIESTWGTAVSRTNWLPLKSWAVQRNPEWNARDHLDFTNSTAPVRQSTLYQANDFAGGSLEHEFSYDDSSGLMLAYAFGKVPVDAGSDPYTHTYTLGGGLTGLTLEGFRGHGSQATSEVFEGCVFSRSTFRVETGKPMSVRHEIIAETSGGEVSQGTPSYATAAEEVDYNDWGTFDFDSTSRQPVSVEWTIDRGITERLLTGSKNTAQPTHGTFIRITGRVTVEVLDGVDWFAKFLAGTQGDMTFNATGSGSNYMHWTFHNAQFTGRDSAISSEGKIDEVFEFETRSDGSNLGVECEVRNGNANYSDNS